MPGFDRTGPLGMGPKTGRGLGRCTGARPGLGVGFGWGRGRGLGFGRGFRARWCRPGFGWGRGWRWFAGGAAYTPDEERAVIQDELKWLDDQTAYLRERLKAIEEKQEQ